MKKILALLLLLPLAALAQRPADDNPVLKFNPATGAFVPSTTNGHTIGNSGGGTWGSITGTLSGQTDLQTALNAKQPLINYASSKTIYVSKGSAATDTRGSNSVYSASVPFATLTAAKAAASSGDTVVVGAGTYDENNLLKDGVNWYFYAGARVTYTGTGSAGIFDDGANGANGAVTSVISGAGDFTGPTTSSVGKGRVVNVLNDSTSFTMSANSISGATIDSVVRSDCGYCSIRARHITNASPVTYAGGSVYWGKGQMYVEADVIDGYDSVTVYSGEASGHTPTGYFWVRAQSIANSNTTTGSKAVLLQDLNAETRVWIEAKQIQGLNSVVAAGHATAKAYITAQKLFGAVTVSTYTVYLNAQKLSGAAAQANSTLLSLAGGTSWINLGQLDDTDLASASAAVVCSSGTHRLAVTTLLRAIAGHGVSVSGGSLALFGASIDTSVTSTASAVRVSGGTANIQNCNLTSNAAKYDIEQTGGTANVINGRGTNTNGTYVTSGTVNYVSTNLNKALNLSDLASASTARANLGLAIGTDVQAYDPDLTTWAGITPGTGVGTALAVNVGSAGAVVVNGGALGTPSSGVGTNLTALNGTNISTGTVAPARLGSGTPGSGNYLRGDGAWTAIDLSTYAPLASPTFTGTVTTPILTLSSAVGSSSITITGATQTTSQPILNAAQTWNASGVTFTGIKENITDTASASGSMLMDLQVGGTSKFSVFKDGTVSTTAAGASFRNVQVGYWSANDVTLPAAGYIDWSGNRIYSPATGVFSFNVTNTSTGATWRSIPKTPTQITADTNNYNPAGSSYYQRWSTDASRNITGMTFAAAQVDGQTHVIVNVGSNNIVLINESASSTAANRFHNSTGADITLAADQEVNCWYDSTTTRWRVSKRGF